MSDDQGDRPPAPSGVAATDGIPLTDRRFGMYRGLGAEEIHQEFRRRVHGRRVTLVVVGCISLLSAALVLADGLSALAAYVRTGARASVDVGSMVTVALFLIVIVACIRNDWSARVFREAYGVMRDTVYDFCDVPRAREAISLIEADGNMTRYHDIFECYLAVCDAYACDDQAAVDRLESLRNGISRNSLPLYYGTLAVCRANLGDEEGSKAALEGYETFVYSLREGSKVRGNYEAQLTRTIATVRPASSLTEGQVSVLRDKATSGRSHLSRSFCKIHYADYLAGCGRADEARAVLVDPTLRPLVPAAERMVSRIEATLDESI